MSDDGLSSIRRPRLGLASMAGIAAVFGLSVTREYKPRDRNCRECCECGAEIGPGRVGRKCKVCRAKDSS